MAATKGYRGVGMEGVIATWYARNTARDRTRFEQAAGLVSERAAPGARVLEVAPGPGYLAIELARRGYAVTAVDISKSFVQIASDNARQAGVKVDVRLGNASELPLPDASFDFAITMAAFKNFTDPLGAMNELWRVLVPGGQASIIDLRKEVSREEIEREVGRMDLSPINRYLTRWTFEHMLVPRAYPRETLERMARESRFGRCEILEEGVGFELRLSKPR